MKNNTVEIGDIARHELTGFEGVADAKIEYLTGCDQFRLQPQGLKDGKTHDSQWFDVNLLKVVKKQAFKRRSNNDGGPAPVIPAPSYPKR